jgi:hypothetical protein
MRRACEAVTLSGSASPRRSFESRITTCERIRSCDALSDRSSSLPTKRPDGDTVAGITASHMLPKAESTMSIANAMNTRPGRKPAAMAPMIRGNISARRRSMASTITRREEWGSLMSRASCHE